MLESRPSARRPLLTPEAAALPFVGRATELAALTAALDDAAAGHGSTVILCGESGVGKSRLVAEAAAGAARRGWEVAGGYAYPVETGIPYAPFSDALLPILRRLDVAALNVLTRGGSAELAHLFPALGLPADAARAGSKDSPAEFKARLLWTVAQLLSRLASKRPLLIALENLHWADPSSLELLHFLARQIGSERILLLCTYNEAERDSNPALRATEQSLVGQGAARVRRLEPLSRAAVDQLLTKVFGVEQAVVREFAALLYGWTRGNAFFIEETLKALVASGRLYERDGTWFGWEVADLGLPRSIRDAVLARVERLSPAARQLAELVAVVGTRASFEALRALRGATGPEVLAAVDELRHQHILTESAEGDAVVYDFSHPILRETLYGELGLARARMLHAVVAEGLEQFYGPAALTHADELAYHFARAGGPQGALRGLAHKAVRYLTAAGRSALAKYANREAANYLSAAVELADRGGERGQPVSRDWSLVEDLAQARQRLGDYDAAMALWAEARGEAERTQSLTRLAAIERRMGLASIWRGRHQDALSHLDAGLAAAERAGDDAMSARILLARGMSRQVLGDTAAATRAVGQALEIAERMGDKALLARVHRTLLMMYLWSGAPEPAREHGARAVALAEETGQKVVACTAHWGLATLGGLTGSSALTAEHLAAAEALAEELRSPVLRVWVAEVAVEYNSAIGDWDKGLALGERAIALARALNQRALLPRLLVWTALLHFGRGDTDRSKRYVDEAWELSGAGRGTGGRGVDIHSVLPAHIGRAYYHLHAHEFAAAIRVGEEGLAIADRTGTVVWAVYRLLPIIAESSLRAGDLERAERLSARLRRESERLGHMLGLAWAAAADALLPMLRGENERAIPLLRQAIEGLEAVPFTFDAARLRRELARRLVAVGDREGALRELRTAHDVFARLGAAHNLNGTRDEIRTLGSRPPARATAAGVGALTAREVEIVRLVSARRSNKEIAHALRISPRTVSTHLSNIFEKVGVASRGELADYAREAGLAG